MKFGVCARHEVNSRIPSVPHINISICNPDQDTLELNESNQRKGALFLKFHDTEENYFDQKVITKEQAKKILDFVNKHKDEVEVIMVNCEAGLSRSPGVAAALSKILNGEDEVFFKRFNLNRKVYRTILEAHYS